MGKKASGCNPGGTLFQQARSSIALWCPSEKQMGIKRCLDEIHLIMQCKTWAVVIR